MVKVLKQHVLLYIAHVFLIILSGSVECESEYGGRSRDGRAAYPFKLRVVTLLTQPYVNQPDSDIDEFVGFMPDLIHEMSKRLNFDYEFYYCPDGKYGAQDTNGEWNGLIGEVARRKYEDGNVTDPTVGADISAAPLTVTSRREQVIDFVKPFQHLGLTLVVQKAYMSDKPTDVWPIDFSIFEPLAPSVWAMVFIIVVAVGLLLGLMNRFNPYEWGGRYNRGQADNTENISFNWTGSIWFVFTTLQWQGFERAPRSIAAKVLTCFWFAFVTLTLVTYIAALVNHLWWASMVQRHNLSRHPITSLADIVSGNFKEFKVGCLDGGSTLAYVRDVAAPIQVEFNTVKKYWETEEGSKQLVRTTNEGIARVRSEKYAFIMTTMQARYVMNRLPCDLTMVGSQFALRSYGLAVPQDSPFLEDFHRVILELHEEGQIESLERKWWEGRGECWNVTIAEKATDRATSLYISQSKPKTVDITMFWSVIVIMVFGMITSMLVAIGETVYYKHKGRHDEASRSNIRPLPSRMDSDDKPM